MLSRGPRTPAGSTSPLWAMVSILLLAVLVPTACMLWFLTAAMRNTNLAARQRLTDVYRGQVRQATDALADHWGAQIAALEGSADLAPPRRFHRLVTSTEFDTVILVGRTNGRPPTSAPAPDPLAADPQWTAAQALEFDKADPNAAADAYGAIARRAEPCVQARALRARARCLARAGRREQALGVLTGPLAEPPLAGARDAAGRLVAPDAMLLALELLGDANRPAFDELADRLRRRLADYDGPAFPGRQRLFLMGELARLSGTKPPQTAHAESWAARYLDSPQPTPLAGQFSPAAGAGLWHVATEDGQTVGLCRQERLIERSRRACLAAGRPTGIAIRLQPPGQRSAGGEPFLIHPAPAPLVGWKLVARLVGTDPFAAAASRQKAGYLWAAALGIVVILSAGMIAMAYVSRQVRLARLKNDLIATVSHELKTPLSSMRVLIDTLVAGRCRDAGQADEYHRMIAQENERLSRVIENFLTFSRMERNRVTFDLAPVDVGDVVASAIESVGERFGAPNCRLSVEVDPDLPPVHADRDALVAILLNLLDNAYKYTGDEKRIDLHARAEGGRICLAVTDNGIGLSRRAARRAFDRFYQVDQHLSRTTGGCGLGLSIVQFIVDAHGGSVDVDSKPGQGSTFTVRLPAAETPGENGQTPANAPAP